MEAIAIIAALFAFVVGIPTIIRDFKETFNNLKK